MNTLAKCRQNEEIEKMADNIIIQTPDSLLMYKGKVGCNLSKLS